MSEAESQEADRVNQEVDPAEVIHVGKSDL